MAEQLMVWENYGDINPLDHGGLFISKDNDSFSDRQFYVIQVIPYPYREAWLIQDGLIDLDDDWIEWDSVKETMGTPEDASDEHLATEVMYYYGSHTGCREFDIEDRAELIEYLQNNGIEIEE
jgi:hypothetical protein